MNTAIQVQVRCEGDDETLTLTEFPVRIGRDDACELHLPYSFVSRRHARIEQDGAAFVLVDEGSCNGIFCNGRRVAVGERVELADGSELLIESLTATVRFSDATEPMSFDDRACEHATSLYSDQQIVPEVIARVGALMEEYRASRSAVVATIASSLNAIPEAERPATVRRLWGLHPELARDPEVLALCDGSQLVAGASAPSREGPMAARNAEQSSTAPRTAFELVLHRILGELSPTSIESATKRAWWDAPVRHRRLWQELMRRHDAILATMAEPADQAGYRPLTPELPAGPSAGSVGADERSPEVAADAHWPFTRAAAWE